MPPALTERRPTEPVTVPPGITVTDACLRFGGREIFRDLSFNLPAGTITALLGPSGVGKTTLLRLIAGLTDGKPEHGSGTVKADDGLPLAGRVAWMAQQDLLLPWLDVLGNVVLGYRLRGQPIDGGIRQRALQVLDAVGLAGRARQRPEGLSGGERQRVALARTLMEDRPVVLMDEPFSALDALTRLKLQDLAAGLLAGRTVLLVTHDPLEALRLAHRVKVMTGSPASLSLPLAPAGLPPRMAGDPALLAQQAVLLKQLSENSTL